MTPSLAVCLRVSIAALEMALTAQRAALAEIEGKSGDAQIANLPVSTPAIGPHLRTRKQAAGLLKMGERRLRRLAPSVGAECRLGTRVLIDMAVIDALLRCQKRTLLDKDTAGQIRENRTIKVSDLEGFGPK